MANFLAIEAASDSFSVALDCQGSILSRVEAAPRMHSRLLYPVLNDLMSEAGLTPNQLDAVIFGKGPGSFTGLRIAASTAQGIGFACDIPLIGVSTLQAMAQQAYIEKNETRVLSIMDARMNELYLGQYELDVPSSIMLPLIDDLICPITVDPTQLFLKEGQNFACGHGLKLYDQFHSDLQDNITGHDQTQILNAASLLPQALSLFEKGDTLAPENVELVYLREQSHWKTIKQQKQQP